MNSKWPVCDFLAALPSVITGQHCHSKLINYYLHYIHFLKKKGEKNFLLTFRPTVHLKVVFSSHYSP